MQPTALRVVPDFRELEVKRVIYVEMVVLVVLVLVLVAVVGTIIPVAAAVTVTRHASATFPVSTVYQLQHRSS